MPLPDDDPRCPQCHGAVPILKFLEGAPASRPGRPPASADIVCPSCGTGLRVDRGRAYLVTMVGTAILALVTVALGFAIVAILHLLPVNQNAVVFVGLLIVPFLYGIYAVQYNARRSARLRVEPSAAQTPRGGITASPRRAP
jgi:hypothetical protein